MNMNILREHLWEFCENVFNCQWTDRETTFVQEWTMECIGNKKKKEVKNCQSSQV